MRQKVHIHHQHLHWARLCCSTEIQGEICWLSGYRQILPPWVQVGSWYLNVYASGKSGMLLRWIWISCACLSAACWSTGNPQDRAVSTGSVLTEMPAGRPLPVLLYLLTWHVTTAETSSGFKALVKKSFGKNWMHSSSGDIPAHFVLFLPNNGI